MDQKKRLDQLKAYPPSLLLTFVTFLETESVTETAKALRVNQAQVSRQLQLFERIEIRGERLLTRPSERRFVATPRGRAIAREIRVRLENYEQILDFLRGRSSAPEVVRLALGTFSAQVFLPTVVAASLEQDESSWEVATFNERGQDRIGGVEQAKYDLAVVSHDGDDVPKFGPNVDHVRLAEYPLMILAADSFSDVRELRDHRENETVSIVKLTGWPLVGLDRKAGLVKKLYRRREDKQNLPTDGHPGGWAMGREYARHGMGVALMPAPLVTADDRSEFVVRQLARPYTLDVYGVRRQGEMTKGQAAVWKLLAARAKQIK